ncbi:VOC family protein [Nocardiopsis sp. HNM0947]|uniref:VOC family protein n=1 Tax=Nocardiopsis coralli TaxID=2772213 RepID=A0ABR9P301_9ACTN|nr:VOC family protein [Nocardiopsis coralli]MBE2998218.1 VOC family protein [Nocardiopsis coralli]
MSNETGRFPAFSLSPVPEPVPGVAPPELFQGIYGMPAFVTVESADLAASTEFWTRGLGFFDFFSLPGQIVHLRRWAFQDVLLVPEREPGTAGGATGVTVSFSCVLDQVESAVKACEALRPGCTSGPAKTPWNTVDVEVRTPEGVRVIMTAARPYDPDPDGEQARNLRAMGIEAPEA